MTLRVRRPLLFLGIRGRNDYFVVIPSALRFGDYDNIMASPEDPQKYQWTRGGGGRGSNEFVPSPRVQNLTILLGVVKGKQMYQ